MAEQPHDPGASSNKTNRREVRAIVVAYHREELRALLQHVREGFAGLDTADVDEFELDDLIHRYKRAAKQLWMFCGSTRSHELHAAAAIEQMRDRGEERDWWAESAGPDRRTDDLAASRRQPPVAAESLFPGQVDEHGRPKGE